MRARALGAGLLVAAALAAGARADEVLLTNGKSLRGHARRAGEFVDLNPYHCAAPEMTFGVERLRELDVREVRPWPMEDHLHGRLLDLAADDVEGRLEVLRLAQAYKLDALATRAAEEVLARQPTDERALAQVKGAARFEERRRGNPSLDAELARELRVLLAEPSVVERRAAAARLERTRGYAPGAAAIERLARSRTLPRGLSEEVTLRLRAGEFGGATYGLYVPEGYDPLDPAPLLLALHGGGIRGAEADRPRGSGRDALAHFLDLARAEGFFLVCPTAIEAPWTTARNEDLVLAILEEVTSTFNVDLERVHLAGQAGGADGAWWLAARQPKRFAAVAGASGVAPDRAAALTSAGVGVWIFHGDRDEEVPVEEVRKVADLLRRRGADFVYCELPREGQGFPPAARRDLQRYLAPKRRGRSASAWPRPSLLEAPTRAYLAAFGDPAEAWAPLFDSATGEEALLARLAEGGFAAEPAARELARRAPAAAEPVRRIVADRAAPRDARRWAAWLLGAWKDPGAVGPLGDLLRAESDAALLRDTALAIARLGSEENVQDVAFALEDVPRRYKALPGSQVAFQDFEAAVLLGAALCEALGRIGRGADVLPRVEETLVIGILRDARPVRARPAAGEDLGATRALLAEALARTYRQLGAAATLFEMLAAVVRKEPRAEAALRRGAREGWK